MIHLADNVSFSAKEACTQCFAFMGIRGSGKTYGFGKLAEGLLEQQQQLVIFDPMGVFWGLRVAKNGKDAGFQIPVFGGDHGDVPLTVNSALMVAELIVERHISAVLDVSEFRMHERKAFVGAFCEHIYELKKRKGFRTPMHVAFDEADMFAPQEKPGDGKKGAGTNMLAAVEHLARRGRNLGIGCSFISQRPQEVNKGILNQTEVLVAMQLNGDLDRQAIERWARQNATRAQSDTMFDQLPHLGVGDCIIWSPRWLKTRQLTHIKPKVTYDSSKTPDGTERAGAPKPLSGADLKNLRDSMKTVEAEVAASDPKKLREQVARLTDDNAQLRASFNTMQRDNLNLLARNEVLESAIANVRAGIATVGPTTVHTHKWLTDEDGVVHNCVCGLSWDDGNVGGAASVQRVHAQERVAVESGWVENGNGVVRGNLRSGARRMLDALVARHPKKLTKQQLSTLAGVHHKGGTFSTYLGELKRMGCVVQSGDVLALTEEARERFKHAGVGSASFGREAVLSLWMPKLRGGAKRMLRALIDTHDNSGGNASMTKLELAQVAGLERNAGTFSTYFGELKRFGLIEEYDGHVSITEELYR